jgi:cytochrome c-type biogenesis protein CcmH/NrfG
MGLSKAGVNFVFAILVAVLGLIAATSLYTNSKRQDILSAQAPGASAAGRLPENRPPVDVSGRLEALEQLIAKNPQNPDYRTQLGNLYYDMGQYDKAADFYQQSLSIRPQNPNVETDLATCFHYLGQDGKALEILDRVLTYSPGFSQAMFNKGIVLVGKNDDKGAIAVWEALLRSEPNFPQKAELEQRINQLRASVK